VGDWGGDALELAAADKRRQVRAILKRDARAWRAYDETCPLEREAMATVLRQPWPRVSKSG
jgi:hypothetical protein